MSIVLLGTWILEPTLSWLAPGSIQPLPENRGDSEPTLWRLCSPLTCRLRPPFVFLANNVPRSFSHVLLLSQFLLVLWSSKYIFNLKLWAFKFGFFPPQMYPYWLWARMPNVQFWILTVSQFPLHVWHLAASTPRSMLSEFPMQVVDKDNTQGGRQEHRETSWRLLPISTLWHSFASTNIFIWAESVASTSNCPFLSTGQQGTLRSSQMKVGSGNIQGAHRSVKTASWCPGCRVYLSSQPPSLWRNSTVIVQGCKQKPREIDP